MNIDLRVTLQRNWLSQVLTEQTISNWLKKLSDECSEGKDYTLGLIHSDQKGLSSYMDVIEIH